MRIFLALLVFFVGWENNVKAQMKVLSYPLFEQVTKEFFYRFDTDELDEDYEYTFAKKIDGWHVLLSEKGMANPEVEDYLFWKAKNNKYSKLNLPKRKSAKKAETAFKMYPEAWKSVHYNVCPYYGYTAWEYDVVRDFANQKNLPDSFVYGVGRAYSSMAGNLLNNNSGFADSTKTYKLKMCRNSLSAEQLATYRKYRHAAIEWFTRAAIMNPNLQTLVGEIGVKTANEFVCAFLELRVYQNEEEALKELPDTLYSDVYLNAAKNYLMSCAPNGILLTNGDNDTYPLIYLQVKKKFRTDVLVVNTSLLNTDRYVNSLRTKVLDAKGLKLSLSYEDIAAHKRDLLLIDSENEDYVELYTWIQYCLADSNTSFSGGKSYFNGPSQYMTNVMGKDTMNWFFGNYYMYLSQLVMLDEIANEFGKRPIYFTVTLDPNAFMGLEGYLALEGMSYRLMSKFPMDIPSTGTGFVLTDSLYTNLMNNYVYSSFNKQNHTHTMLVSNYRNLFYRLAETLMNENKLDSALLVVNRCIKLMPNEMIPYDFSMTYMVEICYKSGDPALGDSIAMALIENVGLNKAPDPNNEELKSIQSLVFQYLKELAHTYKRDELMDALL
jgi:tetratricopeptide (TPR) repeat protein